jgi:putative colanic acid biosynthesis UDP-glucose lipid carrier transferase
MNATPGRRAMRDGIDQERRVLRAGIDGGPRARFAAPLAAATWSEAAAGARAFSRSSNPVRLLVDAMMIADAAVILVASTIAYLIRHGLTAVPLEVVAITLLSLIVTLNGLRLTRAYDRLLGPVTDQIFKAAKVWSCVFLVMLTMGFLTKTSVDYSRIWAATWFVFTLAGFAGVRAVGGAVIAGWRRRGRLVQTVAIVDMSGAGIELARKVQRTAARDTRLLGVFSVGGEAPGKQGPRRSTIDDLIELSRHFRVDEVIVAVGGRSEIDVNPVIRRLGLLPSNIRVCLEMPELAFPPTKAAMMFGQPVLTVRQSSCTGINKMIKRVEDVVLSSLLLLLLAPLFGVVASAIKLTSPGPVLFRQKRLGFNNNVIEILKFRSMTHRVQEAGTPQATRHDPRITRVGAFLRRTSIDELPQLWNVLTGDMSLVGPRPHALAHNDQYAGLIDNYLSRHRVQPGITGWAQVNGFRGETDTLDKMQMRVEHDLAYIDSWSVLLDFRILFSTVFSNTTFKNAY